MRNLKEEDGIPLVGCSLRRSRVRLGGHILGRFELAVSLHHLYEVTEEQVLEYVHPVWQDIPDDVEQLEPQEGRDRIDTRGLPRMPIRVPVHKTVFRRRRIACNACWSAIGWRAFVTGTQRVPMVQPALMAVEAAAPVSALLRPAALAPVTRFYALVRHAGHLALARVVADPAEQRQLEAEIGT